MLRALTLACLLGLSAGMGPLVSLPDEALQKFSPGGGVPSGSAPPCSDQDLLHCQTQFNTFLGINSDLDWHKPWYFHYALQNFYQTHHQQGVVLVCSAYQQFLSCLGAEYASCINPLYFLGHGYGLSNSYTFPAILAGLHFQCGGGLETLLGNYNCIEGTLSSANQTIQSCIASYHINMTNNPQLGCTYGLNLLQCIRAPFSQCNGPSSWFECEYTRVGIALHLPYCDPNQLRCYVTSTSLQNENS